MTRVESSCPAVLVGLVWIVPFVAGCDETAAETFRADASADESLAGGSEKRRGGRGRHHPKPPHGSDAGCFSVTADEKCYSPLQNLDKAYEVGARGCPCDRTLANQVGYCLNGKALICETGFWQAVLDGPCWPPGVLPAPICQLLGGELAALPPDGTPLDSYCPEARTLLGVVTRHEGQVPCCSSLR
jgi:hypothetical protein